MKIIEIVDWILIVLYNKSGVVTVEEYSSSETGTEQMTYLVQ